MGLADVVLALQLMFLEPSAQEIHASNRESWNLFVNERDRFERVARQFVAQCPKRAHSSTRERPLEGAASPARPRKRPKHAEEGPDAPATVQQVTSQMENARVSLANSRKRTRESTEIAGEGVVVGSGEIERRRRRKSIEAGGVRGNGEN